MSGSHKGVLVIIVMLNNGQYTEYRQLYLSKFISLSGYTFTTGVDNHAMDPGTVPATEHVITIMSTGGDSVYVISPEHKTLAHTPSKTS